MSLSRSRGYVAGGHDSVSYPLAGGVSLPSGGQARMTCGTLTDRVDALDNVLTAIEVTTLH